MTFKEPVEDYEDGLVIKKSKLDIFDHITLPDAIPKDLADYMYGIGDFLSKAGPILGGLLIARILLSIRGWLRDSPSPGGGSTAVIPRYQPATMPISSVRPPNFPPSTTSFAPPQEVHTGIMLDL